MEKAAYSTQFIVPISLTHTRILFYEDLDITIEQVQTVEINHKLNDVAFNHLQWWYNCDFRIKAVGNVKSDQTGKYFLLANDINIPVG